MKKSYVELIKCIIKLFCRLSQIALRIRSGGSGMPNFQTREILFHYQAESPTIKKL